MLSRRNGNARIAGPPKVDEILEWNLTKKKSVYLFFSNTKYLFNRVRPRAS